MIVRLTDDAKRDAEDASDWFDDNTAYGDEFHAAITVLLRRIAENPYQFPLVTKWRGKYVWRRAIMPRFHYIALFCIVNEEGRVGAFYHGRRNPSHWQGQLSRAGD